MNYRMIATLMGRILCVEAGFMLPAAAVSAGYGELPALRSILISAVITAAVGGLLTLMRPAAKAYYAREGFVTVALAWILISLFGALPFYIGGEIPFFLDAVFETISGFTTTGASVLADPALMSRGLLYWRSFTHWIGGMGVLVFVLAFYTMMGGSGNTIHLLRAESPGPSVEKLVPKMRQSAKILYGIYIGMTLLQMFFLLIGGMPLFDTVTLAFGTAGTGGFAISADSIGSYSPYLQGVITVFMAAFGVNFSVYYFLVSGRIKQALHNEELRLYLGIMLGAALLITADISGMTATPFQAFHHAAFQVSSVMTTTGYSTVDFNLWPEFSRWILMLLMVVGASAGSTGGGIKVSRLLLMIRMIKNEIRGMLSPRTVTLVRMDGKAVPDKTTRGVSMFMAAYLLIAAGALLLVSLNGMGIETTLSATLACLNNIGPGLGFAGPMSNYGGFNPLSKLVLCAAMLIGRLEIIPMVILCLPSTWKKTC